MVAEEYICDEWNKSFEKFKEWSLSNGYQDHLTIDRINCDGMYEPENCRWVTRKEQSHNMRYCKNQYGVFTYREEVNNE